MERRGKDLWREKCSEHKTNSINQCTKPGDPTSKEHKCEAGVIHLNRVHSLTVAK